MLRLDDIDAMGERGADQIGVDQRRHPAGAGDADPGRHVLRTVRHQQADRLALAEMLAPRPARVAVRPLAQRAVAQLLAVRDQGGLVAVFLDQFVDHHRKHPRRVLGDRRRHPQRAKRAAQENDVILQMLEKGHARLAPATGASDSVAASESRRNLASVLRR
jgi:hypothetical protein